MIDVDVSKIIIIAAVLIFTAVAGRILYNYLHSPFEYPYMNIEFDVSGKRNVNKFDYIDNYIIDNKMAEYDRHMLRLKIWKDNCEKGISNSRFSKRRRKQFDECIDDQHLFRFFYLRSRTRYRQVNYSRYSYQSYECCDKLFVDYDFLKDRYEQLKQIDFVSTLSDYHCKDQRRLMTRELRDKIAKRDNYTCQQCGKYMPDGVGLQIDHIIPVSKGGKSIESNLQVLCSKCNGSKSARINIFTSFQISE